MSQNCIQVKDLTKAYSDITAVNNISFEVRTGEILGILGPNGSGKTTTLKSILGLIEFDKGSILVNGLSVRKKRNEILQDVGAILEGARNIYWHLTPMENLTYFAGIRGIPRKDIADRAEYLLESLKLTDVANKEIRQFSAGMKQKCALACAFIHDPSILLLDEPTLGLDVEITRTIMDWLVDVVEKEGKTILITSHNMDFVESICKRILIIRKGEIISHETVESLKEKFARKHFLIDLQNKPHEALIESVSSLGSTSTSGNSIKVELETLDHLLPLLAALDESGIKMLNFKSVENDLEDIFLEVIREETE
ncbi:MAG: ABC transporter ATP-binding protein [Candidatus Fermentibacteria bacterium]|nr:ABC transporter ATP-binding protein [Candidatus Fermentibacteria bacterium]